MITPAFLAFCGAGDSKAALFAEPLGQAMERADITTPLRVAHFIAQVYHESGALKWVKEIWGPTSQQLKYEPPHPLAAKLGNTQPGDGLRFRGHGLIQLTGRYNHQQYAEARGLSSAEEAAALLETDPDLQADVAVWYWSTRDINRHADRDDLEAVTKAVNGGLNGLRDRARYLRLAKAALEKLPGPEEPPTGPRYRAEDLPPLENLPPRPPERLPTDPPEPPDTL